jgi:hypothetical protein
MQELANSRNGKTKIARMRGWWMDGKKSVRGMGGFIGGRLARLRGGRFAIGKALHENVADRDQEKTD